MSKKSDAECNDVEGSVGNSHTKVPLEFSEEEKRKYTYQITKIMAYHPIGACCGMFLFILIICAVSIATGLIAISDSSSYDWVIPTTTESKNTDALADARDRVDSLSLENSGERRKLYSSQMYFLYKTKDGSDLFTPLRLKGMCEAEANLVLDPDYPKFCRLDSDGECELASTSVVVHFYEFQNVSSWDCSTLLSDADVDAKKSDIYSTMATDPVLATEQYGFWLDNGAPARGYTTQSQSILSFGTPLAGYSSESDDAEDQAKEYQKFLTTANGQVGGIEESLFNYFGIESNEDNLLPFYPSPYRSKVSLETDGSVEVLFYSAPLNENEGSRLITSDLVFAIFSILFVWFWLRVHTGSIAIASMGMYMIFMSIPFSMFLYKGIYRIPFFIELHALVIFVILGVGADDVFVLVDSWKQTPGLIDYNPDDEEDALTKNGNSGAVGAKGTNAPRSMQDVLVLGTAGTEGEISAEESASASQDRRKLWMHRRLLLCYEHTMETVFNTSFTTAMAFVATVFSPLMPIATFGVFAATVIIINYFFCITLMPPVLIVAEVYFDQCKIFPAAGGNDNSKQASVEMAALPSEEPREQRRVSNISTEERAEEKRKEDAAEGKGSVAAVDEGEGSELHQSAKLEEGESEGGNFVKQYIRFIEGSVSFPMNRSTERESVPSEDLEIQNAPHNKIDTGRRNIPLAAIFIALGLLAFGIVGAYYGALLEPPTEEEQWLPDDHMFTRILDMNANDFLGLDEDQYEEVTLTFGIAGIDRGDFDQYRPGDNRGDVKWDNNYALATPMCQQAMVQLCVDIESHACKSDACEPTGLLARTNTTECFMTDFRGWAQSSFGQDTYQMNSTEFYSKLSQYRMTQSQTLDPSSTWEEQIGFVDGELKFASVFFRTTMRSEATMTEKQDVVQSIKQLMANVVNYPQCSAPVSAGGCDCRSIMYTSSPGSFIWLRTEEGLLSGFYQGLLIAFPVAFAVLLYATKNLLISIYAIVSVFFIAFGVLGFVKYALDWDLGIAESVAGIIVIGFSVDYTVHLGHMFVVAEKEGGGITRAAKFEYTSHKIVITIIGGAITTIGAGIFLFPAQLTFFFKMGTLIVGTIVLSWLYSLFFFMSVLYLIGPEGKQGDIPYMLNAVHDSVFGSVSQPVHQQPALLDQHAGTHDQKAEKNLYSPSAEDAGSTADPPSSASSISNSAPVALE